MPITLPDFDDSYCQNLTACGFMDLPSKEILAAVLGEEERTRATIRYRTAEGAAFARLVLNLTKPKKGKNQERHLHVHVDVALRSYFSSPPSTTHKRTEFDKLLQPLFDHDLTLYPSSQWAIPTPALSEERSYPWNTDIKTEVGGVRMKLVGAEFQVTGGKISFLHWRWEDDRQRQKLILHTYWAPHKTKIEPCYLTNELTSEESYLRSSILGETRQPSEGGRA